MVKEEQGGYRIMDLASAERPRERLEHLGPGALSVAELLAILLRVGIPGENAVQLGHRLLTQFGGLRGLQSTPYSEICTVKGMGKAKAAQVMAAIEIGNRMSKLPVEERQAIQSPAEAAELVQYEMAGLQQEHLRVILLDTRNRLITVENLYVGSLNSSTVRVGELFRTAIQRSAAHIILAHNHPSGDPTPSPEDVNLTRSAVQAGKLLDIEVLDHLVIGKGRFISLKERGLGF